MFFNEQSGHGGIVKQQTICFDCDHVIRIALKRPGILKMLGIPETNEKLNRYYDECLICGDPVVASGACTCRYCLFHYIVPNINRIEKALVLGSL